MVKYKGCDYYSEYKDLKRKVSMLNNILNYLKKEKVLTISLILAVISMAFVRPDAGYAEYIDLHVLALLFCPHLVLIGVILCMVLGYKITFDKHDHAFDGENLERTVRTAADNVKHSVSDFAKSFQTTGEKQEAPAETAAEEERSYYSAQRPEPTYRPSCPTLNVPVQVESQDGSVTIEADSEGYASATIE